MGPICCPGMGGAALSVPRWASFDRGVLGRSTSTKAVFQRYSRVAQAGQRPILFSITNAADPFSCATVVVVPGHTCEHGVPSAAGIDVGFGHAPFPTL